MLVLVASLPFVTPVYEFRISPKRAFGLTAFDVLLVVALVWLVINTLRQKAGGDLLREWLRTVWAGLLFLAVALGSLIPILSGGGSLTLFAKSFMQHAEYLLLAPLVFLPLLRERRWRNRAFVILALVTLCTILHALTQLAWRPRESSAWLPHFIGGGLLNRNTFGLFVALAVCVLIDWLGHLGKSSWLAAFFLAALAGCAFTAGGLLVAYLAGLTFVLCRRWGAFGAVLVFILVGVFLAVATFDKPARRINTLVDSVQVRRYFDNPEKGYLELRPTVRYLRWMANLNMIRQQPRLGVGLGQYQKNLATAYGSFNPPESRTDRPDLYDIGTNEPFSFGWYFLAAGELGLPGLAAVFILLGALAAQGFNKGAGETGESANVLGGGVVGAVIVLLLAAFWTNPLVRGTGPLLGFLLAVSTVRNSSGLVTEPKPHADYLP